MTDSFSDDQRRAMDEEGIPDLETPINQDEGIIPPRDHPQGVEEYGITADEQRRDEPLADRLQREEPDVDESGVAPAADDAIAGTIVEPGSEDVDAVDEEKDSVGHIVDDGGTAQTAEEAAMHITDSP